MPEGFSVGGHYGFDFVGYSAPFSDGQPRGFPGKLIEETDEWKISVDGRGVTRKDFKGKSGYTPHWMDWTIKGRKTWEENKHRFAPLAKDHSPVTQEMIDNYNRVKATDKFIIYTRTEPYEEVWPMLGQVNTFTLMIDEPDLIAEMFANFADCIIAHYQAMHEAGLDCDGAFFFGDVGYRNGLLFSPDIYRRLLKPQHRRICEYFHSLDMPVILHSCGRVQELLPDFIDAGFNALQPIEAKAGQDVRELKKRYGDKIAFYGNIDVRALSGTREDIEEEIKSKITIAKQGGGYIYHSDHSVPPTVSWENYQFAMEMVLKYGQY
jgi:uroporphyrinogen decarboxylase